MCPSSSNQPTKTIPRNITRVGCNPIHNLKSTNPHPASTPTHPYTLLEHLDKILRTPQASPVSPHILYDPTSTPMCAPLPCTEKTKSSKHLLLV